MTELDHKSGGFQDPQPGPNREATVSQSPASDLLGQARTELEILLSSDIEKGSELYETAIQELAKLNSIQPGVLTKAIAPDSYQDKSIGRQFGEESLWKDLVPGDISLNGKVKMTYSGQDWLDTLPAHTRSRVELLSSGEKERRSANGEHLIDSPKPHLANIEIEEDGTLKLEVHKCSYTLNAAISKTLCNALRPLLEHGMVKRVPGEVRESDLEHIEVVVSLLRELGIREIKNGIGFNEKGSPFPQTIGVSALAITNDGYLVTAVQGSSNLTSQGHTIPFGSGSVDMPESEGLILDLSAEGLREMHEEVGSGLNIKSAAFLGIASLADQGGKPEIYYAIWLDHSAAEIQEMSDRTRRDQAEDEELKDKFGQPFMIGDLAAELFDTSADTSLGTKFPFRGGTDDVVRFKDIAFHPNTNQILACGMAYFLKAHSKE